MPYPPWVPPWHPQASEITRFCPASFVQVGNAPVDSSCYAADGVLASPGRWDQLPLRLRQRAIAGNATRHRRHLRQRQSFRICNLQNPNEAGESESHSLRHLTRVSLKFSRLFDADPPIDPPKDRPFDVVEARASTARAGGDPHPGSPPIERSLRAARAGAV